MILHPKQIERATAKVKCGDKTATAFLISPNLAITALHSVDTFSDTNEIILEFYNVLKEKKIERKARPLDLNDAISKKTDIAVLWFQDEVEDVEPLILVNSQIPYSIEWQTFGYPKVKGTIGVRLEGTVSRIIDGFNPYNCDLDLEYSCKIDDWEGLSGSPLVIEGEVRGIIISQNVDTLGAISVNKFSNILDNLNIEYQNRLNVSSIPEALQESLESTIPNYQVFEKLENSILSHGGGYFILVGTPGSGKTTIAASFTPVSKQIEMLGRYFLRIPRSKYSVTYKASEIKFAQWLISSITKVLYNQMPVVKKSTYNEYIELISSGLKQLSTLYSKKNRIGVFIIDGLDDVYIQGKERIEKFLGLLADSHNKNLAFLFICNSTEILPGFIREKIIEGDKIIKVSPLELRQTEAYLTRELDGLNIPYSHIRILAEKSKGHPLYLRYVAHYLKNNNESEDIIENIKNIPTFGGDIGSYYERIWDSIKEDNSSIWIVATIARLRSGIEEEAFIKMLPQKVREQFVVLYPKLKYLLLDDSHIMLYHDSFAEYVSTKTVLIDKDIHGNIGIFCIKNQKHAYSLMNCIYHLSKSHEDKVEQALIFCDQNWADEWALKNMDPDLIISDVREILRIVVKNGNTAEVIRILLLLQRLNFRYNFLLAEYAPEIARALIALRKPREALTYIIRQSILIVSNEDAIYFLHKFYEIDAFEEAKKLQDAIKLRYIYLYEKNRSKGYIEIDVLRLQLESITMLYNLSPEEASDQFIQFISTIKKLFGSSEQAKYMGDYLVSVHMGYMLWRFGHYVEIELHEKAGMIPDENTSELLSMIILKYKDYQDKFLDRHVEPNLKNISKDLESLIKKYGIQNKSIGIEALMESSDDFQLIESLINESNGKEKDWNIREENGVDANWENIRDCLLRFKNMGYIDKSENFPGIPDLCCFNWEEYIISTIRCLGFIIGKVHRYKAEKNKEGLESVYEKIEVDFFNKLKFRLSDRIEWERSYALPEEIFPRIFKELAIIFVEFYPEKIPYFIHYLEERISEQIGLYTEGFREVLFSISEELIKASNHSRKAFKIVKILENQIDKTVQNRWERTKDFLKIIELYSALGSKERAEKVYKKMLVTSMGPSWYKEDQLTLMSTILLNLNLSKDSINKYIKEIAGHMDYASGEMTFQRYVRAEKENFIGCLCKIGRIELALEYLKKMTLPEPYEIWHNAESSIVDSPIKGNGYINGTNEVDTQRAILKVIEGIEGINLVVKWALTEIFILGDRRHFDDYARLQAKILQELECLDSSNYKHIRQRLIRQFIAEFDSNFRGKYLDCLKKNVSELHYKSIDSELKKLGVEVKQKDAGEFEAQAERPLNVKKDNEEEEYPFFLPGTFGKRKAFKEFGKEYDKAKEELAIDNIQKAKEFIVKGLKNIQNGSWNLWGNISDDVDEAIKDLVKLAKTDSEFIQLICELILNEFFSFEWGIADKLITILNDKIPNSEAEKIFQAVLGHIQLMVRTPKEINDKYYWIDKVNKKMLLDSHLAKFIIWLSNYPDRLIRDKAVEILRWLCIVEKDLFIPLTIEEALTQKSVASCIISAGILHSIGLENPLLIWDIIKENQDYKNQIISLKHFMIKSSFLELIKEAQKAKSFSAKAYYDKLKKVFLEKPLGIFKKANIEGIGWKPEVSYKISKLRDLGLIDRDFIDKFLEKVITLCSPLTVEHMIAVDDYIVRSYGVTRVLEGNFKFILLHAVNCLISERVNIENYEQVISILREYNPYFPDSKLTCNIDNDLSSIIEKCIVEGHEDYEKCLFHNGKYYMHFIEFKENLEEGKFNHYEVIALLVSNESFNGNLDWQKVSDTFYSTEYSPKNRIFNKEHSSGFEQPAVIRILPFPAIGGMFTPSELHPELIKNLVDINESDVEQKVWRIGRNLSLQRFGAPVRQGCSITISKEKLLELNPKYKLVWLVRRDNTDFLIDLQTKQIYR